MRSEQLIPLRRTTRDFLYLTRQPQARLIDILLTEGWHAVVIDRIQGVSDLWRDRKCSVGIVEIGESAFAANVLSDLSIAIGCSCHWIALVDKDFLQYEQVPTAISRYCFDFCTMPVPRECLLMTLGHAYGMSELHKQSSQQSAQHASRHGIIGTSSQIEALRRSIDVFAATCAPVLIIGETGTGKELTARAIHVQSARRNGPMITVNCGALPASLIQSELFGYERGAFTGADRRAIGKLEAANHGTIFLDEIGDLPEPMQVNLLRFLQEHRIQRVGGSTEIELELRVIAATNVDLEQAVQKGVFREDLFYRLNVLPLYLPPLRERIEDIDLLAEHLFQTYFHERRGPVKGFSREAMAAMRSHAWPGNVRELINRVRRALVICEGGLIGARDLGLERLNGADLSTLDDVRCRAEREAVRQAILASSGNLSEAARRLKVTRSTLYRLIDKLGPNIEIARQGLQQPASGCLERVGGSASIRPPACANKV